ncbi:MAG: peptidylprolyl isomerase [Chlorobi bacterium]|nr:peptidylprolyl isomerase [Chlorobiota bacterium]
MIKIKTVSFCLLSLIIFISCQADKSNPKIIMKTEAGDIIIELYPEKAPITVANFLRYVNENRFGDATFYRTVTPDNQSGSKVKIEVVQGGLFEDEHPDMLEPIKHETTEQTGILHKDGVISMARNEPGTATSEFFICIGDQPALDYAGMRNGDGQGFAAFGKVIEGMDVIRKIQKSPAKGQYLDPRIKILEVMHDKNSIKCS